MAEEEGDQVGIEQQIERAVSSRIQHFKEQSDSLTLESVRRLLEKDLGLERYALDAHKRFIRQYLEKKMDGAGDYNTKTESDNVDKDVHLNKAATSPKPHETNHNLKKSSTGDEEMMEDSPILGVLTPKSEADAKGSSVTESSIKKAIWERADHFLANSENITLAGVRRLLEEDLGLAKNALDTFKKFISQEIDQVLNPPKGAKSAKDSKKTSENLRSKKSKEISRDGSDSSGNESNEMEHEVKSRKEATSRRKVKKVEPTKKRKMSELERDDSRKKSKLVKRQKEEVNDSNADGSLSEDGQSQSSGEKSAQKKYKSTPGYGERVEHLKSIIKACGMSVAPSIYKKVKQVPDNKREAFLVRELEAILSREGLSNDPTEKEIKNCKKRKERARELEGIDMSNIISSSRRRSTFSFVTPEKPEIRAKKDKDSAKENKSNDSKEKDHNDDNEEEDKEEQKKEDEKEKVKEERVEKEGEGDDEEEEVEEEDDDDAEDAEDEDEEEEEEEESDEFNGDDNDDSD